ncbi:MAG: STAS/SEC14 domain-containing protein [Zhongshania sp.]|uniref:STAS/SEC14 domain-containing protein n=1 Tax=Zhongshania sp. TaxID=1971902 RepID=UPI00263335F0|nr:STAS/SEC14 domain-containing protein [Zhongshania sp.]MDF1691730.1 STAS/SEC14 domain-containing protein [Zhongshania sp.]
MNIEKHGVSIGINRVGSDFFLSLKAQGKLTHDDYKTITPLIDSALASVSKPKVRMLFDGSELQGWELRAAWDDFKLGLRHGSEFEKIAIYGNKRWEAMAAKIGNWFVAGEIKYFDNHNEAITWLQA